MIQNPKQLVKLKRRVSVYPVLNNCPHDSNRRVNFFCVATQKVDLTSPKIVKEISQRSIGFVHVHSTIAFLRKFYCKNKLCFACEISDDGRTLSKFQM